MSRTIGIDLGTTNSVVSFIDGARVEVIPNKEGSPLTPSVVFYKSGEEIIVGELAKRQLVANPHHVVRSVKRIMGKRYSDLSEEMIEDLPFRVAELEDGMVAVVLSEDAKIRPEEVSADILESMREYAEDFLGEEVSGAVITVPAHFNDQQRTATKAAAELVGIDVQRIINEPTAAALAYGFGGENQGVVAVFDFGGGTFDISILNISGDVFEVLATNGDNHLGGDNVDERVYQEICDEIVTQTGIDATQDTTAVQRIREAAEKAKCELSTLKSTSISLPFIVADESGPKHYQAELTRERFEEIMEPVFERLLTPCRQALEDSGLTTEDIKDVILVGGSTRIPRVRRLATEFFGREPNATINPDEAVAAGAAIQSAVISGSLREVLLLDVTPLTLGIELAGGVFKPLIERNSTIPCEASRKFATTVDHQTRVMVHVLQGERLKAPENHSLARFRLTGIPAAPAGLAEVEVHFAIDANGILSVSAIDLTGGTQTGVVVENYGEIGSRRRDIEHMIAAAESAIDEDRRYVRFAERRHKAELLQQRANRVIEVAGDVMTEEDLKELKEEGFRLDLAMNDMDERRMEQHEDRILEIVTDYEKNADLNRALLDAMGGTLESGRSGIPTDTHYDEDDLPEHLRSGEHRQPGMSPPDEAPGPAPSEEEDAAAAESPATGPPQEQRIPGTGKRGPLAATQTKEDSREGYRDTEWEEEGFSREGDDDDEEFDVSSMPPPPPA